MVNIEIKKERSWSGIKKEVIYENGVKTGEIKREGGKEIVYKDGERTAVIKHERSLSGEEKDVQKEVISMAKITVELTDEEKIQDALETSHEISLANPSKKGKKK